jgi:endonuclease-8
MSKEWNPEKVLSLIKLQPYAFACDVLMDQQVFSGSGNIIKNEVLFRVGVHPEALIKDIPVKKLKALIMETATYGFEFYEQKKKFTLQDHWLVYKRKICPKCKSPIEIKDTGKTKRKSFFCGNCQSLFKR